MGIKFAQPVIFLVLRLPYWSASSHPRLSSLLPCWSICDSVTSILPITWVCPSVYLIWCCRVKKIDLHSLLLMYAMQATVVKVSRTLALCCADLFAITLISPCWIRWYLAAIAYVLVLCDDLCMNAGRPRFLFRNFCTQIHEWKNFRWPRIVCWFAKVQGKGGLYQLLLTVFSVMFIKGFFQKIMTTSLQ